MYVIGAEAPQREAAHLEDWEREVADWGEEEVRNPQILLRILIGGST